MTGLTDAKEGKEAAKIILTSPGDVLDLTKLNSARKFKGKGNKEGAIAAIYLLQDDHLGTVCREASNRGCSHVSHEISNVLLYNNFNSVISL